MTDSQLRVIFRGLVAEAHSFFDDAAVIANKPDETFGYSVYSTGEHYWDQLSADLQARSEELTKRVLAACNALSKAAGASPLAGPEDTHQIKLAAKTMRAALSLRR